MTRRDQPRRDRTRPARRPVALVGAALAAAVLAGCSAGGAAAGPRALPAVPGATADAASHAPAGGAPGAGTPPLDDGLDGVDADLAARFAAARAAAGAEDVELRITSGKRTPEEQQRLVDEAVAKHGVPEAYRWVLPPETSAHVQGLAIDVGPTQGAYWLAEHGPDYGLCQTYANEVWHFEKLPDGADACPEQHPDSSWGW
ncbi:D-alanyl-D-alanine carboxypeptidase family protein [Cellulomonas sp. ACRRI]|uniref:D-alanyl-D-alanine carboxypeptidase family protein n=1 Tax=Cellulomonas sp. ACRRI TaxID=2918188 RepID=UPI001EF1C274|nr:D-alanyl-D-alanine carboxypeptidase family protein [Cellulomonas sp. ACRRI]MCG7287998.1 D-alanyl-D-alanine carboxypeptidase family protein [Cellulomonas sp. ACRRI]